MSAAVAQLLERGQVERLEESALQARRRVQQDLSEIREDRRDVFASPSELLPHLFDASVSRNGRARVAEVLETVYDFPDVRRDGCPAPSCGGVAADVERDEPLTAVFEGEGDDCLDVEASHVLLSDAAAAAPHLDDLVAPARVLLRSEAVGDDLHEVIQAREAAAVDEQEGRLGVHAADGCDVGQSVRMAVDDPLHELLRE
jgi:hypothetical protein